jgi:hypothetical protein
MVIYRTAGRFGDLTGSVTRNRRRIGQRDQLVVHGGLY